jgi:hypothetical protein
MSTLASRAVGDNAQAPIPLTGSFTDSLSAGASVRGGRASRHVLWINQHAAPVGGAEHYIATTAAAMRERNVRSTLLYEVDGALDTDFLRHFDAAFCTSD